MRFTLVNMLQASLCMFRVPLSFPAPQVCRPSSPLPRDVAGCPNVIVVDLQSGSQVCHLLRSLLSMDSVDQLQPDLATPITACFDRVFEPQRKRKCFLPRKARNGTVASTAHPFCGHHHHSAGAAVAKVQKKMCLQRLALLQGAFQGHIFPES